MDSRPGPEKGTGPEEVLLLQELLDLSPRADILDSQLVLLTILAGLVALVGLFLNSSVIIIGSMIISPLLEPIYAGTVFLANGAGKKFLRHTGVLAALVGIVVLVSAIVTATLAMVTSLPITHEILTRMEYQEISAILAILLGIIVIVAHKRGFLTAVIGVGISVALMPPIVVTGIAMVLLPARIFDAFSLVLINILGLFTGMLIAVIGLGVGPRNWMRWELTRRNVYLMTLVIAGLLIGIFVLLRILHPGS